MSELGNKQFPYFNKSETWIRGWWAHLTKTPDYQGVLNNAGIIEHTELKAVSSAVWKSYVTKVWCKNILVIAELSFYVVFSIKIIWWCSLDISVYSADTLCFLSASHKASQHCWSCSAVLWSAQQNKAEWCWGKASPVTCLGKSAVFILVLTMVHLFLLSVSRGRRRTWRFYGVTCLSIKPGIISRWSGHPISSSMAHWETATWRKGSQSVWSHELTSQKWTVWMHQIKSAWYKNKCSKEMQMCAHTRLTHRRRIVVSRFLIRYQIITAPVVTDTPEANLQCVIQVSQDVFQDVVLLLLLADRWVWSSALALINTCIYEHISRDQLVNYVSCSSSHSRGAILRLYTEFCFTWQNCFSKSALLWINAALCVRPVQRSVSEESFQPRDRMYWFMSRWSKLSFYFQGEILDRSI